MASFLPKLTSLFDGSSSSRNNHKTRYLSLNEGLQLGSTIIVKGRVFPAASKFEINLLCGSVVSDELIKGGSIALHLAVIPSGGYALLNSRTGKTWNKEERTPRGRLPPPLLQNRSFSMAIEVERQQYRVDVNGHQFTTFLHREPFESVGLLSYEGDFEVENVQIQPPSSAVTASGPVFPLGPQQSSSSSNVLSNQFEDVDHLIADRKFPRLPLLLPIKAGLVPGMIIAIDGQLTGNRFDLSLYQGSNPYGGSSSGGGAGSSGGGSSNDAVPFHMEVYLKEMTIIRNSYQAGAWQSPEKELTHFPFFGLGTAFRLVVRVEANRYQVSVGGRYLFDFYHRVTPLASVDHLCVHGALEVSSLQIAVPPL